MKTDFSAEYVLNREASTLTSGAASVQTASLKINQDELNFRCEGRFSFVNGETKQWAFDLTRGESDATRKKDDSAYRWDGEVLIATILTEGPTITFRYELDEKGRLFMEEQLRGTDHDQDNLWVFERL